MFSHFPDPNDLGDLIRQVQAGRPSAHYDILVELILSNQILKSVDDPRHHELWDTAYRLATHAQIAADAREDFLLYCDDYGVYLEEYEIECMIFEREEGGNACEVRVRVDASGEQNARNRAEEWVREKASQLADQYGLSEPYFLDFYDSTRRDHWSDQHQGSPQVNIASINKVA